MRQLEERYLERLSQLYPTIAKASTEDHQSAGDLKSAKGYRTFSDGHSWGIRGIRTCFKEWLWFCAS